MSKRVFITKKEAKELVNNLRFAYHDHGRHLGLNVKFYNFPLEIERILWESYKAEVAFDIYFGTPISTVWDQFRYILEENYGLKAYQSGRSGGYWGVYISQYDNTERLKKIIKKAFYESFCKVFCTNAVQLLDLGRELIPFGNEFISIEIFQYVNGKREYTVDGVPEWKEYVESQIIPLFEQDSDDKWRALARAFQEFSHAWKLKEYVCNIA